MEFPFKVDILLLFNNYGLYGKQPPLLDVQRQMTCQFYGILIFTHIGCCSATEVQLTPLHHISVNCMQDSKIKTPKQIAKER